MKRIAHLLLFCSGFAALGCGQTSDAPQLAIVEGTVTWKGKPLADAAVAFTPTSGPVAIGQTDDHGHYHLTTQGRAGAAIGAHRVTINALEPIPAGATVGIDAERPYTPVSRIPVKFTDLAKSGLDATVNPKAAENRIDFDLK